MAVNWAYQIRGKPKNSPPSPAGGGATARGVIICPPQTWRRASEGAS
ncbi:MAG UNVERIFIED_CONTAM: hypothetical protein LVT10_02400 [Anaerolineae bacterium]